MAVWTVYLSLCLLMALTASVEGNPVQSKDCGVCWTGWSSFGCRCFKFMNYLSTWIEAEKFCLIFGGNLASVHSHEEYMFIQRMIRSRTHASTRAWIGGNDAVQEGDWLWSDGSKMNYQIWAPGEPNNSFKSFFLFTREFRLYEDCLEMNYDNGNWNDDLCSEEKPFVCVK
ncbi:galactose-specific lectin nattectin-like [Siphateles boraxobius]|uniref:galactose-specific lectin nattectin-like n=1 Tax=Siphateles boraxobius TaxID=180520 RepID=UPI0040629381